MLSEGEGVPLFDDDAAVEARLSAGDGQALAWLYRNGRVVSRGEDEDGGVLVSVRLDRQALGRFERQFPQALLREAAE